MQQVAAQLSQQAAGLITEGIFLSLLPKTLCFMLFASVQYV